MSDFEKYLKETNEVGHITSITSALVYATGLPGAKVGEKIICESGEIGMIQGLDDTVVEILMFSNNQIKPGSQITRTNQSFQLPVGVNFLGRSLDALANPIDGGNPLIKEDRYLSIFPEVAGIKDRARISEPFNTGVTIIDTLVPLGRGQRELVIGDAKSGKTGFLLQTILSQKGQDVVCIYVAIGKKKADIKHIQDFLNRNNVNDFTILIAADAASNPSLIYLAPYTGMTFAEHFRDQGKQVVLILDDLSTHAKFYREISLQGKKSPGREGYPGDIYFVHSRMLERGGKFKRPDGTTATITLLPVVESINGDFTGLIPTNIMSMTDGHVFFDIDLMQKGQVPPVNVFLSVSRVGNQTRSDVEKQIDYEIRNIMSQYRSTVTFSRFGVELSDTSKALIRNGEKINTLFSQLSHEIVHPNLRLIFLSLLLGGFWDSKMDIQVDEDRKKLVQAYQEGKMKTAEKQLLNAKNLDEIKEVVKINYSSFLRIVG